MFLSRILKPQSSAIEAEQYNGLHLHIEHTITTINNPQYGSSPSLHNTNLLAAKSDIRDTDEVTAIDLNPAEKAPSPPKLRQQSLRR